MSENIVTQEGVDALNAASDAVAEKLVDNKGLRSSDDGRETITFTTPLGKEVIIKAYLNTIERRSIRRVYSENVRSVIDPDGTSRFEMIEGRDIVSASEDRLVEEAVVSYDGSKEDILGRLVLKADKEYKFVLDRCNEIGKDPK